MSAFVCLCPSGYKVFFVGQPKIEPIEVAGNGNVRKFMDIM